MPLGASSGRGVEDAAHLQAEGIEHGKQAQALVVFRSFDA